MPKGSTTYSGVPWITEEKVKTVPELDFKNSRAVKRFVCRDWEMKHASDYNRIFIWIF